MHWRLRQALKAAALLLLVTANGLLALYHLVGLVDQTYPELNKEDREKTQHRHDAIVRETNAAVAAFHHRGMLRILGEDRPQGVERRSTPPPERDQDPAENRRRSAAFYEEMIADYEYSPHDIFYVTNPRTGCEQNTFLLIIVCSAAQNMHLRAAIRATWGRITHRAHLPTKVVFMLGLPGPDFIHIQKYIVEEADQHGDIIQEDFQDYYSNLTLKSIGALKWATSFCRDAKFVMKADDDIYINLPNLYRTLMDMSQYKISKYIIGHVIRDAKPISDRKSKWFNPLVSFNQKIYPKYTSGTAYVMSGNLVDELFVKSQEVKLFWLEDIFVTGMVAREVGATLLHDARFTITKLRRNACTSRAAVTLHGLSAPDMHTVWRDVHNNNIDCTDAHPEFPQQRLKGSKVRGMSTRHLT